MRRSFLVLALTRAAPALGQYSYYFTDGFNPAINGSAWQSNGTWSGGGGLVRSTTAAGASLISKVAVPDGSSSYEVRTLVRLSVAGGTYVHYLRASQDALTGPNPAGTFYSVEWGNLVLGDGCQMTMTVNQRVGGVFTQRASLAVGCLRSLNNTLTSVLTADGKVMVYVNGTLVYGAFGENVIQGGQPGVGVIAAPVENGLVLAQLGPLDRAAPPAVERGRIATAAMPGSIDLQWQGSDDGAGGTGVPQYFVYRNGTLLSLVHADFYSDQTVQAGQSYTYALWPVDRHGNFGPMTTFAVTAPAVAGESRRVGVRGTGAYWGGAGEQIDAMSGNLNFSVPLLSSARRDGWKLPLGLSYNSQNWRMDPGQTVWNLGRDIGYGYGWMLMAGQMRPHYSDLWTVHHWTFVDASGAEYRLDQYEGGLWRSREETYVRWDAVAQRLWWPDGTFWNFYCVSGAGEADRGTLYPTVFQDRSGNVVTIEYHGGWASGLPDTSGRIGHIVDVRAGGNWNKAYQFYYSWSGKPHLERITSLVATGENYVFTYSAEGTLISPFTGAGFGTTALLTVVKNEAVNLQHTFTYGSNGSGELVKAVLPKGAELEWSYGTTEYGNGKSFREVTGRWLRASAGAPQWGYAVYGYPGPGGSCVMARQVIDPASQDKAWLFQQDAAQASFGLVTEYQERKLTPSFQVLLLQQNTWVQDSHGRPYVGTAVTFLDPWTAQEKVSKVEVVLDAYGNVTEQRFYDYGSLSTPVKTVRVTMDAAMAAQGMLNRAQKVEVTGDGQTVELASYKYDGNAGAECGAATGLLDAPGMSYHDAAYGTSKTDRGLVTYTKTPGRPGVCVSYDIGGNVVKSKEPLTGREVAYAVTSASQWTAPSTATPDQTAQLASSYQYNSVLALSQESGPNGATMSYGYDSLTRPASVVNAHGGVTTYTYSDGGRTIVTQLATGGLTRDVQDGLGRTVQFERGDQITWRTRQLTEYGPCACSPLGKVKRVSNAYLIAGGTPAWTEYEYDARGRTVKVTPPGGAGYTSYIYEGNTVKMVEPGGTRWKKFTINALGRLVKVTEPQPGGGADVETSYEYNVFDKLKKVTMARGGVTQIRTFNYNTSGQLASVTQPENGTVSYTYDELGRMSKKTDQKGNIETPVYGSRNRVVAVYRRPAGWAYADDNQTTYISWDTAVNGWGRVGSVTHGGMTESFEYTVGGLVTKKRAAFSGNSIPLEAVYSWNNAGQMTSMKYPDVYNADGTVAATGRTLNYQYSALGPLQVMTDWALPSGSQTVASALFNGASQMTQLKVRKPDGTMDEEDFTYNERGQLRQQSGRGVNIEYRYSASANDGRLVSRKDNVSGEEVVYEYDELGRLITAATSGAGGWGLSWVYDGFGNRLSQNVTKGSMTGVPLLVDGATNRISSLGYGYDANGNQTQWPAAGSGTVTAGYDVQNRMVTISTPNGVESYGYSASNQRVKIVRPDGMVETLFYGLGGELLGVYGRGNGSPYFSSVLGTRVWFAGRMIESNGSAVVRDRLGSVEKNGTVATRYYPYGEEMGGATAGNREKFATYTRDSVSGLDYAWNRYYSSTWGRFTSADPYVMSGGLGNPQGWNRYAYVLGDPVNGNDPLGLNRNPLDGEPIENNHEPETCGDIPVLEGGGTVRSRMTEATDLGLMARIIWHESYWGNVGGDNVGYYAEKYTIGLAMLNRYAIAHGALFVSGTNGQTLKGAQLGFGDSNTSLAEVMLMAAGQGQVWGIVDAGGTDLNATELAKLGRVLNSSYKTGKLYDFEGPFGTFKVNSECYQVLSSWQAASRVLNGYVRQENGSFVAAFWNLSSTSNPGLAQNVALLGKTSPSSPTFFWGFINGYLP
jgi:RHS repeat-associated protein